MKFQERTGNYLKSNNTTNKIMNNFIIALIPIIIYSFYKNGIMACKNNFNIYTLFKPLIMLIVSIITSYLTEYIWFRIKEKNKNTKYLIKNSHGIIPAIMLTLILPINTPITVLILGSIFASFIGKLIYGGIGKNIFNPALIGRLFIITAYSSLIMNAGGYLNDYEKTIDAISGATPLTNFDNLKYLGTYDTVVKPYGGLLNFFIGNIPGAIGETSALLCIIGFIYLIVKKSVKWRIPIYYILTVFTMTTIIGLLNGMGLWYPMLQILSGGLFFGAIFMATDPVTSPITDYGQKIYGLLLGLLTVTLRYLTPYPEGVLTSILVMNLFVPIINKISINVRFSKILKTSYTIFILTIIFVMTMIISVNVKKINNVVEEKTNLQVINKEVNQDSTIYEVKHKGFMSPDSIHAKITIKNNKVTNIEILDTLDHYYDSMIKNTNYLDKLITNQNNLDTIDAISGATYTSKYLKEMVKDTLKYHKG